MAEDWCAPMHRIQQVVCRHHGITMNDLMSDRREKRVSFPRHIAMYLCRETTIRSFPEIGALFNRDHTSVVHAVNHIRGYLLKFPDFQKTIDELKAKLEK